MADFEKAFAHTNKNEGGYANNPADRGGETYKGISRKNWPTWKGWVTIDEIKRVKGKGTTTINSYAGANQSLQALVKEFYKVNFWYPLKLQLLTDDQLAVNIYDFAVNAGVTTSAKRLQRAANEVSECDTVVDGQIGDKTIALVNSLNAHLVYDAFNRLRKAYYDNIIAGDPSQKVFKNSWYSRIIPYIA